MPSNASPVAGAPALIGPPPPAIPVLSAACFLLMAATLYYLFFRFTFTYQYEGTLSVSAAQPQQLVVTIPGPHNLNGARTRQWRATIRPLAAGFSGTLQHRLGVHGMDHNSFTVRTALPLRAVPKDTPLPCQVQLTSAPLVEKLGW